MAPLQGATDIEKKTYIIKNKAMSCLFSMNCKDA